MQVKTIQGFALGTLLSVASTMAISCGNTKTKNVDNILDKDKVELSEIKEKPSPKIEEISFERNKKCEERTNWDFERIIELISGEASKSDLDYESLNAAEDGKKIRENLYEERGTYGASMLMQKYYDDQYIRLWTMAMGVHNYAYNKLKQVTSEEDLKIVRDYVYSITHGYEPTETPACYDTKEFQDYLNTELMYQKELGKNDMLDNFRKRELIEADQDLYSDGPLSYDKCLRYLDRELGSLSYLSMDDYDKIQKDVNNFKEALEPMTIQKMAELVAYKQFKLDSVIIRQEFEEAGYMDSYEVRKAFDEACQKYKPSIEE